MSERMQAGRIYDAAFAKNMLAAEIKRSKLTREQIAAKMSQISGDEVTVRRLNAFTAESREDFRFPLQLAIVFCEAVGSYKLLSDFVMRAGFRMIGPNEERLIAIGNAFEAKRKAEKFLAGVGL